MSALEQNTSARAAHTSPITRIHAPSISYVICTNPRSGSWLLSEGLGSTNVAGNPREWFHHLEEERERTRLREQTGAEGTYEDYIDWMLKVGSTPNRIFGIKLHFYQFMELQTKLSELSPLRDLPIHDLMAAVFPNVRYIWLTRRDKVRQALSYYRASRTAEWWRLAHQSDGPAAQTALDLEGVARKERELLENDSQWRRFFGEGNIEPHVVAYEDLAADYNGTILNVLRWLEVPNLESVQIPASRLTRQSDELTEKWLAEYLRYKSGGANLKAQPAAVVAKPSAESRPTTGATTSGAANPAARTVARRSSQADIPDAWKTWIGANRLLGTSEAGMIDVMARNGFDRTFAQEEVARSARDPYLLAAEQAQTRLNKALALMGVFDNLQALNSQSGKLERRSNLTRQEFIDTYYSLNRPVLLEGMMDDWPAMTRWTPEFLKSRLGDEMVEVMKDRNADPQFERNSAKHRRDIRFGDYVDMVYSGEVTNEYYLVANNAFFQRVHARQLLDDIRLFPEFLNGDTSQGVFFWFGPAGTMTPLHHDTSNIFMAQVSGRKRIRMAPAFQWRKLYNSVGVFSDVDPENPDFDRWPEFRNATVIDFVLEPGQVLFMPVGWWHHVRALDPSIMLSFTNFAFPNHFKWPS